MEKDLKEKSIKFKGKDYVLISDRVLYFNETYKSGSIQTELVSDTKSEMVIIKAIVIPDVANPERKFTGYSQARWNDASSFVNKTSALENAETSAIGRALGFMGIGVIDGIASIDEINKANNTKQSQESSQNSPKTDLNAKSGQDYYKKIKTDYIGDYEYICAECVYKGNPYYGWSPANKTLDLPKYKTDTEFEFAKQQAVESKLDYQLNKE